MKKIISIIITLIAVGVIAISVTGCSEADNVSYNISKEANNFNVTRRLAVINARTDKPVFELIGNFSLANNGENELECYCPQCPFNNIDDGDD